jgi:hypothetical protein
VIAIDPEAAQRRHELATSRRNVRMHPLADGLAELVACLPAVQARQGFDALTAAAHSSDGPDEQRTLEQRRADALMDLLCGRAATRQVQVTVTVDAETLVGQADEPAELAGYGPITARQARQLVAASDPIYRRLMTAPTGTLLQIDAKRYRPTSGLEEYTRVRDFRCRFPGCRRPATTTRSGTDVDHTVPWPAGPTAPENLAVLCRHHHRVKHSPGWQVEHSDDGTMTWTTPGGHQLTTSPWQYPRPPDP